MKITLVTCCLNQADTIEAAILSVLDQTHPAGRTASAINSSDLEYIIIDGGSTDGTTEIIRQYADRLAYWTSEPDRGQSHALNKGFAHATGDIFGWLNADDLLLPGALASVIGAFSADQIDVLCGQCRYDFADGESRVMSVNPQHLDLLDVYDPIHQPSCFWTRQYHEKADGLDEQLHYGMDWDLWLRMWRAGARFSITEEILSVYRMTGHNKTSTGTDRRNHELYHLLCRYARTGSDRLTAELAYRALWPLKRFRTHSPRWLCRPLSDLARTTVLMSLGPMLGFDRVRCCTHPFS